MNEKKNGLVMEIPDDSMFDCETQEKPDDENFNLG